MFSFTGGYVPVRDLDAAAKWYAQAFGCKFANSTDDDAQRTIVLQLDDDDLGFMLGPAATYPPNDLPPIIFTDRATKANEHLTRKGVLAGPIQQDEQGTKFFEIRDCDGNVIEVSEEP